MITLLEMKTLCSISAVALISAGLFLFSQSLRSEAEQAKQKASPQKERKADKAKPVTRKRSKRNPGIGSLPLLQPVVRETRKFGEESESRERAPTNEAQITNLQEKLTAKDRKIADLKARLAKQKSEIAGLQTVLKTKEKLIAAHEAGPQSKAPLNQDAAVVEKTDPQKTTPAANQLRSVSRKQNPPPRIAPVYYKKRWAVNYRERERVLVDVKELLEEQPKTKISLVGHADDSIYDQANHDVSLNRARFLADFLVIKGVPQNSLTSKGVGNTQKPKIGPNRRVDIYIK